jgi:hypothetical protein
MPGYDEIGFNFPILGFAFSIGIGRVMSATVIQDLSQGSETSCISDTLTATRFIRKMRGGAQSVLLQCTDHRYAVVKMVGNPQGPNILANEFIGSVITSAVGLPTAKASLVYLSDEFIDRNPGIWFETPEGRCRPEAGIHFGSLFIGEPDGASRPTDYISRSRVLNIQNRSAFLGMYILDLWANHQDNRQAILINASGGRESEVHFIDHGHMFAGPRWKFSKRLGLAYHLETSVYSDLWHPAIVAEWVSRFEKTLPSTLSQAISLLPTRWYKGNVGLLYDVLLHRLANLNTLIEADSLRLNQAVRSTVNDILRLPRGGVHMFGTSA